MPEGAKLFETQTQMTDMRSTEEAKFENDDINAEILDGLSLCVKE